MATTVSASSFDSFCGSTNSTNNNNNNTDNNNITNHNNSNDNNNNENNSNISSLLNSELFFSNTDKNLRLINKIFPFSIEITEKIIGYAYYMDAPNVIPENCDNQIILDNKISLPSTATNLTKGRYSNLQNLMLVNSGFHFLCLQYQYKYCKFIRSFNFNKFLLTLINTNELGNFVNILDFQEFTAVGLGKSIESIVKIPNLTSITLLKCLKLCSKNLNTLLLSESIDNDINFEVLQFIFNDLKNLKSLDFCGSSNDKFIDYFNDLEIKNDLKIENLSFHECLNFPTITYNKILSFTPHLKKLDLSHTQITLKSLTQFLNKNIRLTHLSLRKCTQLGTITEFIKFLKHPSICGYDENDLDIEIEDSEENNDGNENDNKIDEIIPSNNLIWLNIQQCFSSDTLTSDKLDIILDILSKGASNLEYINLNGYANVNGNHIKQISGNFLNLQSLSICDLNLNFNDVDDLNIIKELNSLKNLKFLDFSSNLWNYTNLKNLIDNLDYVEVFEVKPFLSDNLSHCFKINKKLNDITNNSSLNLNFSFNLNYVDEYWRVYNNKGISRRCWIHKLKNYQECEFYDNYENEMAGGKLIEWDVNSGNLLLRKVKKVGWLGLACVKINCYEDDEFSSNDSKFGSDQFVRGLYKYYSLNV